MREEIKASVTFSRLCWMKNGLNIPQWKETAWDNPKHQNIKAHTAVKNYTYINCYWLYFCRQKSMLNQLNGVGRFKKNYF